MRRAPFAYVAIAALVAVGVWVATHPERPRDKPGEVRSVTAEATPDAASKPLADAASFTSLKQGKLTASPATSAAPPATPLPPPDPEAMIEADKVSLMIRDYRSLAGENPVGTNAEIMAALMGGNPKQAKLGPPEGMQLNENGELIDRWGTPYFFHQLSGDHMEIRSAGADKVMWTDDDAVVR